MGRNKRRNQATPSQNSVQASEPRLQTPGEDAVKQKAEVKIESGSRESQLEKEIVEESIAIATRKTLSFEKHHKLCKELVKLRQSRLSAQSS